MLIPSKHEDLNKNILVLGADLLSLLKRKSYNIENLFQDAKQIKALSVDQYYNTLTFLWLSGLVKLEDHQIILKK
jgi:hypothetical protein